MHRRAPPPCTHPCPNRSYVQKVLDQTGQIKHELIRQLIAEFMGVLLFQIFGGAAPPKETTAPAANGFALVAIVYTFANISGAHLNPAVTFALMCTGHMKWWKGLLYIVVQVRAAGAAACCSAATSQGSRLAAGGGEAAGCLHPLRGCDAQTPFEPCTRRSSAPSLAP